MKRVILLLLLVIALALAASYIYIHAPRIAEPAVPGADASGDSADSSRGAQITLESIEESTDAYTIDVQYPRLGIPSVDALIRSEVDSAVAALKGYPPIPEGSAATANSLTGRFEKLYMGDDIASVELSFAEYTGGAHPNTVIDAVNVDLSTGEALTLSDALALIGKSLPELSSKVSAQLKEKLGEAFFSEGATADEQNFQTFRVNGDTVTFVFQNYQVAPYAAGPQEVSFPRVR